MQIAKIMPVNFRAAAAQQPLVSKPSEEKNADSNVSAKYLENLARLNAPAVKKIDLAAANKAPYKNNLRTMIQNNQAVMLAIVPRTFTAQDLNGDDKVTLSTGEKCGTLLLSLIHI